MPLKPSDYSLGAVNASVDLAPALQRGADCDRHVWIEIRAVPLVKRELLRPITDYNILVAVQFWTLGKRNIGCGVHYERKGRAQGDRPK